MYLPCGSRSCPGSAASILLGDDENLPIMQELRKFLEIPLLRFGAQNIINNFTSGRILNFGRERRIIDITNH